MTSYEALYCRKFWTPLCWSKLSEKKLTWTDLMRDTKEKVWIIQNCLKVASDQQMSYADLKKEYIKIFPEKRFYVLARKENSIRGL